MRSEISPTIHDRRSSFTSAPYRRVADYLQLKYVRIILGFLDRVVMPFAPAFLSISSRVVAVP